MTRTYLPGSTIGIMGGGQLGRMFAIAARRMGYRVHVFTPEKNSPTAQFADRATVADYRDESAVRGFAREIDLLTFEFENIPGRTIEWCSEECDVRPSGAVLHTAQNRWREKDFLVEAEIPVAAYRKIAKADELSRALEQIGRPAILKSAAFGYDGKGQQLIAGEGDVRQLWEARPADELILERAVSFEKEISVIVVRGADGAVETFPPCENVHRDHILDVTIIPARVDERIQQTAADLASTIAEKLDLIGILAVEMFLEPDGKILVNELAPRPHNSGHGTIEGCVTSQFEQHLRAVCGLPLGSTEVVRPSAMANLLGDLWQTGEPDWIAALNVADVHLHLYGKKEPRPRRKMGHLTALGSTAGEATSAVLQARNSLTSSAT